VKYLLCEKVYTRYRSWVSYIFLITITRDYTIKKGHIAKNNTTLSLNCEYLEKITTILGGGGGGLTGEC
jgi:hypothetical protein